MRVRRVQHPAPVRARPVVDHRPNDRLAESHATVIRQHVHIGQVCGRAIAECPGEADHSTGRIIDTHHTPGFADLAHYEFRATPLSPVGLSEQELNGRFGVDSAWIVINFIVGNHGAHDRTLGRVNSFTCAS